jgi:hypothetical protein
VRRAAAAGQKRHQSPRPTKNIDSVSHPGGLGGGGRGRWSDAFAPCPKVDQLPPFDFPAKAFVLANL